jgi:membrane-associated protein
LEYLNYLIDYFSNNPYLVVFLGFTLILFFVPLSEELILFVGGYLSRDAGGAMWLPTLAAGVIGVVMTDYWYYLLARIYGKRLAKLRIVRRIFPDTKRRKALKFIRKYGAKGAFIVRFIPGGIRNPVFVACGISHMTQQKFLTAVISGALISSQIAFWAGYFFSEHLPPIEAVIEVIQKESTMILIGVAVVLLLVYFIGKMISKKTIEDNKS